MTDSPTAVGPGLGRPGRLALTGYAFEQGLCLLPLIPGLVLFVVGGVLVLVWVGLLLVAASVPLIRLVANRQRQIAARVLAIDIPPQYRPTPSDGAVAWLRTVVADPMTWRD